MSYDRVYHTVASGEVAIDSTGDKYTWTPPVPVELVRIGVTGTTSYTHGSGAIIAADIKASDGDGTYTRGDGDGGTITVESDFDAGLVNYYDETARIKLVPGDQLVFQVTQAADAGDGVVWAEYIPLPFVDGNDDTLVNATEVTS